MLWGGRSDSALADRGRGDGQKLARALGFRHDKTPCAATCPTSEGKERRATLEGKSVAMTRLVQRVTQREGPQSQHRVTLTDGVEALPQQVVTHLSEHTLVLDIMHATEYLWDTANLLLGATHPHRTVWVRSYLEPLVAGWTQAVLAALEAEADDPTYTATQRRAVRLHGHWDRYWQLHRQQPHQRLYHSAVPVPMQGGKPAAGAGGMMSPSPWILVTLKSNGRHPAESADLLPEHRTVGTLALPEESDIFSEQFGV
jgi:hypothetical protein